MAKKKKRKRKHKPKPFKAAKSLTSDFVKRLAEAKTAAYKKMEWARIARQQVLQQFSSERYGDNGSDKVVLFNKLHQTVNIWIRRLTSLDPQILVTAKYPNLRFFGEVIELDVNRSLQEHNFAENLATCVVDSLFGVGIMKTGLAEGDSSYEVDGQLYDPGQVFSESVSLNNYVVDIFAGSYEKRSFEGHRYSRPRKWIQQKYQGI